MPGNHQVEQLLSEFRQRRPIRAGSLIVTVFGDSISQHGNSIWLGSLIELLEPFGLNERLVRTAVYRLCQDDWLASRKVGRRSYYRFSDSGQRHFQHAANRIYQTASRPWDGRWTLVMAGLLQDREREQLRQELRWLGFGTLSPGLMAHPSGDRQSLDETLGELGLASKVVVLAAQTGDQASQDVLQQLSFRSWNIKTLEQRYRQFSDRFGAISTDTLSDSQCFALRTLLIHEYRRILLRDADLPQELLPKGWSGLQALGTVTRTYRQLHQGAERHLMKIGATETGPLPPANGSYMARFGGLEGTLSIR